MSRLIVIFHRTTPPQRSTVLALLVAERPLAGTLRIRMQTAHTSVARLLTHIVLERLVPHAGVAIGAQFVRFEDAVRVVHHPLTRRNAAESPNAYRPGPRLPSARHVTPPAFANTRAASSVRMTAGADPSRSASSSAVRPGPPLHAASSRRIATSRFPIAHLSVPKSCVSLMRNPWFALSFLASAKLAPIPRPARYSHSGRAAARNGRPRVLAAPRDRCPQAQRSRAATTRRARPTHRLHAPRCRTCHLRPSRSCVRRVPPRSQSHPTAHRQPSTPSGTRRSSSCSTP